MRIEFIFLPAVGALIGWFTNLLAIKFIFRPFKPFRLPLTGWTFQGLIPKRRAEMARSIGQVVENELISVEDIIGRSYSPKIKQEVIITVKKTITEKIVQRIPGFIPLGVQTALIKYFDDVLDKEIEFLFEEFMGRFSKSVLNDIKIGEIVEERINRLDIAELERLVVSVSKQELKHIEILGGVIGFLIGAAQAIILFLF